MKLRLILLALLLPAVAAAQNSGAKKKRPKTYPPEIPGATAHSYKRVGDVDLKLFIMNPKDHQNTDKRPAVVFFFGGGWNAGSPTQFAPHCAHYAEKGLVAITVDYRVKSRHNVQAVKCLEDAKSAIRWVRQHAAELGVDPSKIIAGGGSAGGHLAAATGTIKAFDHPDEDASVSSVPNAMMLFNPACVIGPIDTDAHGWNERAATIKARAGVEAREFSPYHHVSKKTPPAIIFHSKADTTVPYRTAEMFAEAMKEAGRRCELVGFDDMPHGFFNQGRFGNKPFTETLEKADAFLKSLGYL